MIDIQLYRSRIGIFSQRLKGGKCTTKSNYEKAATYNNKEKPKIGRLLKCFVVVIIFTQLLYNISACQLQ